MENVALGCKIRILRSYTASSRTAASSPAGRGISGGTPLRSGRSFAPPEERFLSGRHPACRSVCFQDRPLQPIGNVESGGRISDNQFVAGQVHGPESEMVRGFALKGFRVFELPALSCSTRFLSPALPASRTTAGRFCGRTRRRGWAGTSAPPSLLIPGQRLAESDRAGRA